METSTLEPIHDSVLVELTGELTMVELPDKQYATNTTGKVLKVALNHEEYHYLLGKQIYFEAFKDLEVTKDDRKFAFVNLEDIRGFDNVQTES